MMGELSSYNLAHGKKKVVNIYTDLKKCTGYLL